MNITILPTSKIPSDPPSALFWNMKWLGYLAASLLFATIIFPVLAGPAFRLILQWYIMLKNFWRVGFLIFWIFYTMAYCATFGKGEYEVAFGLLFLNDMSIVSIASWRCWIALRRRRIRGLDFLFLMWSAACILIGMLAESVFLMGSLAWIALPILMFYQYKQDARRTKRSSHGQWGSAMKSNTIANILDHMVLSAASVSNEVGLRKKDVSWAFILHKWETRGRTRQMVVADSTNADRTKELNLLLFWIGHASSVDLSSVYLYWTGKRRSLRSWNWWFELIIISRFIRWPRSFRPHASIISSTETLWYES